jgi:hypothetical protein
MLSNLSHLFSCLDVITGYEVPAPVHIIAKHTCACAPVVAQVENWYQLQVVAATLEHSTRPNLQKSVQCSAACKISAAVQHEKINAVQHSMQINHGGWVRLCHCVGRTDGCNTVK